MRIRFCLAAFAVLTTICSIASAEIIQIDFGDAAQQTAGWNNISDPNETLGGIALNDSLGAASAVTLNIVAGMNGVNTNGTTTPDGNFASFFPASATRDSFFGNSDGFGAGPHPIAIFRFDNLDAGSVYSFRIGASRTGVGDNRETEFILAGLNTDSALLNVANNTGSIASVSNIAPLGGSITLTMQAGPANTNGSAFYYIGGLVMESTPAAVPEPSSLAILAAIGLGGMHVRRRRQIAAN